MEQDTKAPKGGEQIAREHQLQAQMDGMKPPSPEVDTPTTAVPRSEMMTAVPKAGKDVNAWKPGKQKHID